MAEFFLELFSEEIPARMQEKAAEDLARLVGEALRGLAPAEIMTFYGPRRIALVAQVAAEIAETRSFERGPRSDAPEQALAGFLRKHQAAREDLRSETGFFVLEKIRPAMKAAELIESALPALLRRFPWPKSMRWGGSSGFTWVRPLRRIVCLLDRAVVPFSLALDSTDDGHGLVASDLTEGHRFHAPGAFAVRDFTSWRDGLANHFVVSDPEQRRLRIAEGLAAMAASLEVTVARDDELLREVAGLCEYPVVLAGEIDKHFMDLPAEVMQVSMRVNQRYFATRAQSGGAAPYFIFAANIDAADQGAAIIAGNERVLRARFADARHFWDLDRRTKLEDRVGALDGSVFHAKLGTQGARAKRISLLAAKIAGLLGADKALAARAGILSKADLTTGMVGEFPELQGVMGGYYARHDGEPAAVADAVRDHYLPRGVGDEVPVAPISIAVALADKFDQLCGFFAVGEKPSGSGDPYALRRAALGIIRIIRENGLRVGLLEIVESSLALFENGIADFDRDAVGREIFEFSRERLRVQLRGEGKRHDVVSAVLEAGKRDDDLVRVLARTDALTAFLQTTEGGNLLAAYKRASNILRIEDKKDGPHGTDVISRADLVEADELELDAAIRETGSISDLLEGEKFAEAMALLAQLRAPLDAFFTNVTVNTEAPVLRRNRLGLLAAIKGKINEIADFGAIDG